MTNISMAFDNDPAFIPYLAAGDPGRFDSPPDTETAVSATKKYVKALVEGGADIVELGLPFSEPIADGPTIRAATARALDCGITPKHVLDLVADLPTDVPLVIMTYYNPIYRFGMEPGVESFVSAAARAGVDGIIVPDLPIEESAELSTVCDANGIDLIFIVAPTTRADRLERILDTVSGYLYVQSRLGTTGTRVDVSGQTRESLDRIRRFEEQTEREPLPKAVGFGISTGEQAATVVRAGADGIIVGSALVDRIASSESIAEATIGLREDAEEFKAGCRRGINRPADGPEMQ